MYLKKVPNKQSQELMEDFYKSILAGQSRAETLRGAQLQMEKIIPTRSIEMPSSDKAIQAL